MDEKISLKEVEEYSLAFASKVAESFFSKKSKISGAEILTLCETKQINLFVIRELLKAWKQETQKYKSPYFDYEAKEVKDTLTHFQNILSNHISIAKDHFLPLLKKGVSLTVYLIMDPYDFYSDTLDRNGKETIRLSELKDDIRYIKINKPPLDRLVQKIEERKLESIQGNEAFAMLDQILEEVNFHPEDVDLYLAELSKTVPLELEKLYERKEQKQAPTSAAQPTNSPRPIINEQIQRNQLTTIADDFQKIPMLKDRLTINQKFMFTKMLFNGDFDTFNKAVTLIDELNSLDEATSYIDSHYSNWDKESEEYEEFMELVTKRFS